MVSLHWKKILSFDEIKCNIDYEVLYFYFDAMLSDYSSGSS